MSMTYWFDELAKQKSDPAPVLLVVDRTSPFHQAVYPKHDAERHPVHPLVAMVEYC